MLDNTPMGLIQEILFTSILTVILILVDLKWNTTYIGVFDLAILLVILFLLLFYVIRVIRLSIVYRNSVWLNMLHLPTIGMLVVTGQSLFNNPNIIDFILFSTFGSMFILLIFIRVHHRKFRIYSIHIPSERYLKLRAVMTPKQRLTLVFPDRYIKYLETGDERYLKGGDS